MYKKAKGYQSVNLCVPIIYRRARKNFLSHSKVIQVQVTEVGQYQIVAQYQYQYFLKFHFQCQDQYQYCP